DTAGEAGVVGEEVIERRVILAVEDCHARSAASVGPHDNIRDAVAVDVPRGDEQAAGEAGVEAEEVPEHPPRGAVEDAQVGSAARRRRRNDVGHAITVDVTDGDADATSEARVIGEEVEL